MQEEKSLRHRALGRSSVVYAPLAPPGGGGCARRSLGHSLCGNAKGWGTSFTAMWLWQLGDGDRGRNVRGNAESSVARPAATATVSSLAMSYL